MNDRLTFYGRFNLLNWQALKKTMKKDASSVSGGFIKALIIINLPLDQF